MSAILGLDPGPTQSGWVVLVGGQVVRSGVVENDAMLVMVRHSDASYLAIERIEAMGMAVGREVFETVHWSGRFHQAWRDAERVMRVTRRAVKLHLCGNMQAKDTNIRQALLDMFPATGGGKTPQVGTKGQPGPLYGVASHAWSALAVAVTAAHQMRQPAPAVRQAQTPPLTMRERTAAIEAEGLPF